MYRTNRILGRDHEAIIATVARFLLCVIILSACSGAEDDGNDGASKVSADNGRSNDEAADRDEWYADDPYMPTDDEFIQQIRAELDAERSAMNYEDEFRTTRVRQLLINFVAISVSIVGLVSAVFCTSILLYDLRTDFLMRRYTREGVVVESRILVSDPDIEESMKAANVVNVVKPLPKIQNNDSYSIMTDDESYQAGSRSLYSFSVRSGAHDVEKGQKSDGTGVKKWSDPIGSEVSFTDGSNQSSTSKSREQTFNAKTATSDGTQNMRFHVIVEYDDISYHDVISQYSSEIIRKRLWVMSEDVEGAGTNFSTKLHVLQDKPMSGYPCGEVRRALRWQKRLSFNVHIMLGLSFAICGAFVAKNILSPTLFHLYMGFLVLQLPMVQMFLQRSFTKVISEKYLENGYIMPSKLAKKPVDKQKMIAALKQGSSFGHL
jgi:hypothetical protein